MPVHVAPEAIRGYYRANAFAILAQACRTACRIARLAKDIGGAEHRYVRGWRVRGIARIYDGESECR